MSPGIPESMYFVSGLLALLFDGTPFALVLSLASFSSKAVCNLFRSSSCSRRRCCFRSNSSDSLCNRATSSESSSLAAPKTTTRPSSRVPLPRPGRLGVPPVPLFPPSFFCSPRLDEDDDDGDDSAPEAAPTRIVPSLCSLFSLSLKKKNKLTPALLLLLLLLLLLFLVVVVVVVVSFLLLYSPSRSALSKFGLFCLVLSIIFTQKFKAKIFYV